MIMRVCYEEYIGKVGRTITVNCIKLLDKNTSCNSRTCIHCSINTGNEHMSPQYDYLCLHCSSVYNTVRLIKASERYLKH